jgi:hypothetical protein
VVQTQALHHARPEILHQHVATRHQRARMRQIRGLLQVEHHGFLAGIHRDEGRGHAVVAPVRAIAAHGIAARWRLDLDDLGAQQPQQVRGVRTCHDMTEIRDADALEHRSHSAFSRQVMLPSAPTLARARSKTRMPSMP